MVEQHNYAKPFYTEHTQQASYRVCAPGCTHLFHVLVVLVESSYLCREVVGLSCCLEHGLGLWQSLTLVDLHVDLCVAGG